MPNQGMLRSEGVRADRNSIDTGTGERRLAQGRDKHIGRGAFMNFYEDLGISATAQGAKQIRKDEAGFQGAVKKQQGVLDTERGKYNEAMGRVNAAQGDVDQGYKDLPEFKSALSDSWSQHSSSLLNVKVVDKENRVMGSYLLPSGIEGSMSGQEGLYTNRVGNNLYVAPRHFSASEGLMSELSTGATNYKTNYMDQAGSQIAKELGVASSQLGQASSDVSAARADVETYGASIDAANKTLQGTRDTRAAQWDQLHADYQGRQDTMASIFGGLKIEEG